MAKELRPIFGTCVSPGKSLYKQHIMMILIYGNNLPSIDCPTITYTYMYNYISHVSINLSSMN